MDRGRLLLLAVAALALAAPDAGATSISASWLNSDGRAQSGESLQLRCEVTDPHVTSNIHLLCPLNSATSCAQDCKSVLSELSCKEESRGNLKIYTYTLTRVLPTMAGQWYCQQRHVSSEKLTLAVTERPEIVGVTASPNPVQEGRTTVLQCSAKASLSATLTFVWRFKGRTLAGQAVSSHASNLTLREVNRSADGIYICEVSNASGNKATQSVILNVYYPPSNVRLVSSHSSPLNQGTRVSLSCQVIGGRPAPTYEFFRKRPAASAERISADIVMSKSDNQAAFFCRASSAGIPGGSIDSARTKFDVRFAPNGVRVYEAPSVEVKEGQTQMLRCSSTSSGNPTPRLQWQRIARNGETTVMAANSTQTIRDVEHSSFSVEAVLAVVARRQGNDDAFKCSLFYQERLVTSQRVQFKVIFGPNAVTLSANPMGGVRETFPVYLQCEAQVANPPAKVVWRRQNLGGSSKDVTYLSSASIKQGQFGGSAVTSSLKVTETTREFDLDLYTCRVEHTESSVTLTKTFYLRVFYPPAVKVKASPASPVEGQSVNLTCITSGGKPTTGLSYTWRHRRSDGELVTLAARGDVHVIRSASHLHAGAYTCEVTNEGGRAEGRLGLVVQYSPVMLSTTETTVSGTLGATATFVLRLVAHPKPTSAVWFKVTQRDGQTPARQALQLGSKFKENRDDFLFTLQVSKVVQADFGEYACEVQHPVKAKTFTFRLVAPVPPIISADSLGVSITGNRACVTFDPPLRGHFSHLVVRACAGSIARCHDHHVAEPQFGKACITLSGPPSDYNFKLLAFDGATPVFESDYFRAKTNLKDWPMEIVVGVSIGVGIIVLSLTIAVVVLIVLRCRRDRKPGISMSSTDSHTTSSSRRRRDYLLIGTEAEIVSHCRCSSPPSSDCHSVHSLQSVPPGGSQADSLSLRSGGSRPPDLVLTDQFYLPHSRSSVASSGNSRTSLLSSTRASASTSEQGTDSVFDRRGKVIGPDTVPHSTHMGALSPPTKGRMPGAYRPSAYQHSLPPTVETNLDTMENYV